MWRHASGPPKTLRAHGPDFVLLDGTLDECDPVGDGEIVGLSPALPSRTRDLPEAPMVETDGKVLDLMAALPDP